MSSVIKKILKIYEKRISDQDRASKVDPKTQEQKIRIQKLGSSFVTLLVEALADQDQPLKPKQIQNRTQGLLGKLSQKHTTDPQYLQRILGLYLTDPQIDESLHGIKTEFQTILDDYEINQDDDSDNLSQMSQLTASISEGFPSIIKFGKSQMGKSEIGKSIFFHSQQPFYDVEKEKQEIGTNKQIRNYLARIKSPPTQLNYICQHFGWGHKYSQVSKNQGLFDIIVIVDFKFKEFNQELREVSSAVNKRLGKMQASLKMLAKIYASFPQVWTIFTQSQGSKIYNSVSEDASSFLNQSILQSQKVQLLRPQASIFKLQAIQTDSYLKQIKNFKSELNFLCQQLPHQIVHDKMEKMQHQNGWKVKGKLLRRNPEKLYQQITVNANSKRGQQQVARLLLTKLYQENPDIMQIISMQKSKKGIIT